MVARRREVALSPGSRWHLSVGLRELSADAVGFLLRVGQQLGHLSNLCVVLTDNLHPEVVLFDELPRRSGSIHGVIGSVDRAIHRR